MRGEERRNNTEDGVAGSRRLGESWRLRRGRCANGHRVRWGVSRHTHTHTHTFLLTHTHTQEEPRQCRVGLGRGVAVSATRQGTRCC